MIIKGTGGLGTERMSGDHPNYYISEVGQNTKKDTWRLEVTCRHSNFSEKSSANADVKNSQGVNNNNNNNP